MQILAKSMAPHYTNFQCHCTFFVFDEQQTVIVDTVFTGSSTHRYHCVIWHSWVLICSKKIQAKRLYNRTKLLKSVHGLNWTCPKVLKSEGPTYCQQFNNMQQKVNFRVESITPFRRRRWLLREIFSLLFRRWVVKLNKGIKVRERFENAVFN